MTPDGRACARLTATLSEIGRAGEDWSKRGVGTFIGRLCPLQQSLSGDRYTTETQKRNIKAPTGVKGEPRGGGNDVPMMLRNVGLRR